MPIFVTPRSGKFSLRVKHKLLPKAFHHTFVHEVEANNYGNQLEALLNNGIIPQELLGKTNGPASPLLLQTINSYEADKNTRVAVTDKPILALLLKEAPGLRMSGITFPWVNDMIAKYKVKKMAPGTIRKRIGALAKVDAWHHRQMAVQGQPVQLSVLALLPKGYSQYSDRSVVDKSRDLRLLPNSEAHIILCANGLKVEGRERAWGEDPEMAMAFQLIVETGLRLRELYTLHVNQLDAVRGVLNVAGTKGHHGALKPRMVPLKKGIRAKLIAWCEGKKGLMFSFWDGTEEDLDPTSNRLSKRFKSLFQFAGQPEFNEHDLRHEACCRWVMLKGEKGWLFNDLEICKIMGWTDPKMMLRYASLRGEDLADRLL